MTLTHSSASETAITPLLTTSSLATPVEAASAPFDKATGSATSGACLKVSYVVPCHNEAETMPLLLKTLEEAGQALGCAFEVLCVDDGSKDTTLSVLLQAQSQYPWLRVLALQRCFGQSAALKAGFDAALGDFVITLDADLQNDPRDAKAMLAHLEAEGLDVVNGWRHQRQDALWTRNLPSWIANNLIAKSTGVRLKDNGCGLKVYRAWVVRSVSLYGEMHRFLPVMAALQGARIQEFPVSHQARQFGQSKYGLSRTFKVFLDLSTVLFLNRFLAKPMYFFGVGSWVCVGLALVSFPVALLLQAKFSTLMVWFALLVTVGWLSFGMGLLAELMARIYFALPQGLRSYQLRSEDQLERLRQGASLPIALPNTTETATDLPLPRFSERSSEQSAPRSALGVDPVPSPNLGVRGD
jgi:glycosyltransferase involved in cell wall biosynthesis